MPCFAAFVRVFSNTVGFRHLLLSPLCSPECLVPGLAYAQKWTAIILLPVIVFSIFMVVHSVHSAYMIMIRWRWREWKRILSDRASFVSATLLLFYMLYLYLVRTIFEVFNCVPSVPPDGQLYMMATFEACGVPGGTQLTLLPYAIIGLVGYGFGYPAFLGRLFWKNRELIMEDQYLRALGTGDDALTNPHAYDFRRSFARSYYQFRPVAYFWVLVIIARKFALSVVALLFRCEASLHSTRATSPCASIPHFSCNSSSADKTRASSLHPCYSFFSCHTLLMCV